MKNGIEKIFHPTGQLRSEIPYVNGAVHGVSRAWHLNGVLAHEIPMAHGHVSAGGRKPFWSVGLLMLNCITLN